LTLTSFFRVTDRDQRCEELLVLNKEDEQLVSTSSAPEVEETVDADDDGYGSPFDGDVDEPPAGDEQQQQQRRPPPLVAGSTSRRSAAAAVAPSSTPQQPPPIIPKFEKRKERLCALCHRFIPEDPSAPAAAAAVSADNDAASDTSSPVVTPLMKKDVPPPSFGDLGVACEGGCGKFYHRRCLAAETASNSPATAPGALPTTK
jgi:hypothetical protein